MIPKGKHGHRTNAEFALRPRVPGILSEPSPKGGTASMHVRTGTPAAVEVDVLRAATARPHVVAPSGMQTLSILVELPVHPPTVSDCKSAGPETHTSVIVNVCQ